MHSTTETLVIGVDDVGHYAGHRLGASQWHEVSQHQVNTFGAATGDSQWIHTDPKRAASGPFGRTVAHGYLTLSLTPMLLQQVVEVTGASLIVNYGANKVRFPAPLPVGAKVRLCVECIAVEQVQGGVQATLGLQFEVEGQTKPCCVAEILFRYYE